MSAVIGDNAIRLPASSGNILNTERVHGNAMLRWNDSSNRAEYSTDGSSWTEFGSGGGIFALNDAVTTDIADVVDADEIRFVADSDNDAHSLTMQKLKEFLVKYVANGTSLKRVTADRYEYALEANANATERMLFQNVAVTASGASRVLTFQDGLGENGQSCKISNAGSTAFSVNANTPAAASESRPLTANNYVRVEKYSGKWYFI